MVQEDYVSYEVAKLLKEKGFDWECEHVIWDGADDNYENYHKAIPNPTHQMAMKWLREVHNIDISIFPTIETDMIVREDYNYAIYKNKTVVYQSCSISHEEAVEAALKYCLENLI